MQCSKMTLKAILEDRVVPTEALRTAPVEAEGKQRNTFHLTAAYLHSNIRWITFLQNVEGNVFFLLFLQEQNKCDNILKHKAILDQLQSGFSILSFNKELEKAPSKFEHFFAQSSDEVSPAFVVSLGTLSKSLRLALIRLPEVNFPQNETLRMYVGCIQP